MAMITNAFTTYDAKANREDLSNSIYNIDPFDTPVMSAVRRRNVKNRIFDWQMEFLPVVNGANIQFEGFAIAPSTATPTIRLTGTTQISERDATVSGSQEEVDAAGKGSEMAHQMAICAKVLKSDMEMSISSRQPRVVGSTVAARQTEGICHWIARTADRNSALSTADLVGGAVVGVFTGMPTTDIGAFAAVAGGSQVSLTEVMMNNAMQKAYANGASPTLWVLPAGCKRTASTFVGRSTSQVMVGKTEVVSTVDVFATDFGRIKAIPSRWIAPDTGLLLDPDYWAVAFFRAFRQYLIGRLGDAENRMIVVEYGVEARNSLSSILFNGIKP